MTKVELTEFYLAYIACLNAQDRTRLGDFVGEEATHNGQKFGLSGYHAMLVNDFTEIPDLHFNVDLLVIEPPHIAARLQFDCSPRGTFFGLPINGRRVRFAENVFYEVKDGKIWQVWSVIDKAEIEKQL